MNADPAELEKFGRLAHRWWDPEGEFRPLHEINPLRLDWIDRHAGLAGKKVLDVGCGGGILAEAMARRGAEVTGIDLSEKGLRVAELHLAESRARRALRKSDGRGLRRRSCGRIRRRHLHGASRACPRARRHGRGVRAPGAARRPGVLLDHQPQSQELSLRGRRRRVRAQAPAQGHARLSRASSSPPSSRAGAARQGSPPTSSSA